MSQRIVDSTTPPRAPVDYRKTPPPEPLGRNEVIDIFGRWHMLPKVRPITLFRRLRAKLGFREPLDMVAGDINLPGGGVIMCDVDERLDGKLDEAKAQLSELKAKRSQER